MLNILLIIACEQLKQITLGSIISQATCLFYEEKMRMSEITQEEINKLKGAVGARRELYTLGEELTKPGITYEEFRQVWREIKDGYPEVKEKNQS